MAHLSLISRSFVSLSIFLALLVCTLATCPCHVPCSNKQEMCTCYGPPGDDGYGCKRNGGEYSFHSQVRSGEHEWQVQCIRHASCSISDTLDDTNPFAAYEQAVVNLFESFDDDEYTASDPRDISLTSGAAARSSRAWFGGNWFDFWGTNQDAFFASNNEANDNLNTQRSSISYSPAAAYTGYSGYQSYNEYKQPKAAALGYNKAGYRIVSFPLYILIICIIAALVVGMLMCAGFVYCGMNCCCPLPPSMDNEQPRMTRMLYGLNTFGLGYKSHDEQFEASYGVYHRMRHALHNPTNDEASSMASAADLLPRRDEYSDSEDDLKEEAVTRGEHTDDEEKEPFSLYGTSKSDIDQDSDDGSIIEQLNGMIDMHMRTQQQADRESDVVEQDVDGSDVEEYEEEEQKAVSMVTQCGDNEDMNEDSVAESGTEFVHNEADDAFDPYMQPDPSVAQLVTVENESYTDSEGEPLILLD